MVTLPTTSASRASCQQYPPAPCIGAPHRPGRRPSSKLIDAELEKSMEYAQKICSLVHSIRKSDKVKIKVRIPLRRILLPVLDQNFANRIRSVEEIILAEVNVKGIEYIDDTSGIVIKEGEAQLCQAGQAIRPAYERSCRGDQHLHQRRHQRDREERHADQRRFRPRAGRRAHLIGRYRRMDCCQRRRP